MCTEYSAVQYREYPSCYRTVTMGRPAACKMVGKRAAVSSPHRAPLGCWARTLHGAWPPKKRGCASKDRTGLRNCRQLVLSPSLLSFPFLSLPCLFFHSRISASSLDSPSSLFLHRSFSFPSSITPHPSQTAPRFNPASEPSHRLYSEQPVSARPGNHNIHSLQTADPHNSTNPLLAGYFS